MKSVTLGQYFPGDSLIHRLDPRTKLLWVIIYIVALFAALDWYSYGVMMAVTAAFLISSKVKLRVIMQGLRPLIIIIILTAVLNMFYTDGTPVLPGWPITWEGIKKAVLMILRIIMLIAGTFLLTYTTSPIMLTDGMELLNAPLKKLHFPVHETALMMSMALRFIPTLTEETNKIMSAQRARGADFDTGNIIQRAKAMIPILVPLFVSSFRRADELAVAMESRCYHGGEGRTRLKQLHYAPRDWIALGFGAVLLAGMFTMRHFGL